MSLIAVCGSQGQGKTTILSSLSEEGHNVVGYKTSRTILKEWGYTLNEVNKDPELTKKFQDEILVRHHSNNIDAINSDDIFFSERSYADIFTYTLLALGSFNEYSKWLNEYYEKCKIGQRSYDAIIRLGGRTFNVSNDGTRSVNVHFTNTVDMVLKHYIKDFGTPLLSVDTPNHNKRMEIILQYIK
jgi:predicted ATPase